MFYWLIPRHEFPHDAWTYNADAVGFFVEIAATFGFTSFALLLIIAGRRSGHWVWRALLPVAFVGLLAIIPAEQAVVVAVVQLAVFVIFTAICRKVWRRFEIRDIMALTMFFALSLAYAVNFPLQYLSLKSVLVGTAFGMFTLIADAATQAKRIWIKWIIAILIPYTALLILVLSCRETKSKRLQRLSPWLVAFVSLPVLLMIGDLLYKTPLPPPYATGPNSLGKLISVEHQIGDWTDLSDPQIPMAGPDLQKVPEDEVGLVAIVSSYAQPLREATVIIGEPAWMSVNYNWIYSGGFKERCPQRNIQMSLNQIFIANARLAMMHERSDDAIKCYVKAFQVNQMCGNGGLPLDRSLSMNLDVELLKEIYRYQDQYNLKQLHRLIDAIIAQDKAYEPFEAVMDRRRAWEDRVPRWNQQLLLRYLKFKHLDPLRSKDWQMKFNVSACRLMVCELAISGFRKANKHLPQSLAALVPDWIGEVPFDPFLDKEAPLKFTINEQDEPKPGYSLYSLAGDQIDHKGRVDKASVYKNPTDLTLGAIFKLR